MFGLLMSLFENTSHPGAPYLLVGIVTFWAFLHSYDFKDVDIEIIRGKQSEDIGLLDEFSEEDFGT